VLTVIKRTPPSGPEENTQDDLQNYLDTLLMQATESPEAQIDDIAVSDTPPRAIKVSAFKAASGLQAPQRRESDKRAASKPFAEPANPLSLKVALPKVAAEIVTPEVEVIEKAQETETAEAPQPVAEAPPAVEIQPVAAEPALEIQPEQEPKLASPWLDNGRPVWAQDRFECLLFSVGGLVLAVPLVELGSIHTMTDELTPLFGQADWFMGLLPIKDSNIRTVNTAKIVMPERYKPAGS
jgi:purine-binding chemotaxis protein CheW